MTITIQVARRCFFALPAIGALVLHASAGYSDSHILKDIVTKVEFLEDEGPDGLWFLTAKFGGSNVENGSAYDKGSLEIQNISTLIVPENAEILPDDTEGRILIYLEKKLLCVDFPVEPITIRKQRVKMGCKFLKEGNKLELKTYGEWTGTHLQETVKLVIKAPKGLKIERQKPTPQAKARIFSKNGFMRLTGPDGKEVKATLEAAKPGVWYALPTTFDLEYQARSGRLRQ